jgi:SnoaL-like domain
MTSHDAEGVRQAIYRYARGVDRLDAALLRECFWPDARVTLGTIYDGSPQGFVDVAIGFMGMFAATRHDVGNVVLVQNGDGIGYEAYVRAWHWHEAAGTELEVFGRYIGRAQKRGDEWRLAEHGELMDWGAERPVDAQWFAGNAELEKGKRSRADGSYRWVGGAN